MRGRAFTAAVAALLVATACTATSDEPGFRPAFEKTQCPPDVAVVILTSVSCGYLTVLEDRSMPDGRTIRLFAIRIQPPEGIRPSPDPMFDAGYEIAQVPSYASIGPLAQRTHREVILLDQRGTGHSEPSLACPEVRSESERFLASRISDPSVRNRLSAAARACYDRLVGEGIDPSAYTLGAAAADIEDLRRVLGISRWNLISHGTTSRLVLEVMRRFPEHIRTAVLDSPQFPQVDELSAAPTDLEDAMGRLMAHCVDDRFCDSRFPDLSNAFRDAAAQLQSRPVTVDVPAPNESQIRVVVDGAAFVRGVRVMLSDNDLQLASRIPAAIYAALDGNVDLIAGVLSGDPSMCVGYLPRCDRHPFSEGTYYSYVCSDEVPFVDPSTLAAAAQGDPGIDEAFGRHPYLDICESWPVGSGDPVMAQPVISTIPTLLFHGELDAFSPASLVRQAGSTLSESFVVEAPSLGHDLLTFDCYRDIRNAWVDAPASLPDMSCEELSTITFEASAA
jgi:pimeloyl-ACP methyl ester carboxylesterase